ncbi:MAG: ATP-dependent helicase HrpB, partial [Isosphaeraceae bacterium]
MALPHLPIDDFLGEILAAFGKNNCLVLVAEPGAGKTSRVPPALVTNPAFMPAGQHAVMLQPRRTAARSAAEWIAREQGWQIGAEVGYQVRFESRIGPKTRLR